MRAVIFANGEFERPDLMAGLINAEDFIIVADGGLRHIRSLKLVPNLLVGDLDSVNENDLDWLKAQEVEILKFPTDKDFTDLELALDEACKRGFTEIMLTAALGGRADHAQANIALLSRPEMSSCNLFLNDGLTEIRLITEALTISGSPGDIISLIPLCNSAVGVLTKRLEFPLNNETLSPGQTRGISNVMQADSAWIGLQSGQLLCIHVRQNV